MNKQSQSLLDFINVFPIQAILVKRSPISNKEAQTLFKIWKGDKSNSGGFVVPVDVDPMQVAGLTTKGMIKNKCAGLVIQDSPQRSVEITSKGKQIIRNIILYSEKSSFEQVPDDFNYEAIHTAFLDVGKTKEAKTASRQVVERNPRSWLEKLVLVQQDREWK